MFPNLARVRLCALVIGLLFPIVLSAQPDNSRRSPHPSRRSPHAAGLKVCEKDRARGQISSKCLKRLLRNDDVRAALEQTPAFQDGRLNFRKLEILAERLFVSDPARVEEDYNVDEEVAEEHLGEPEPDGRPTLIQLDDETLRRLREAMPVTVVDEVVDPVLGPATLENIPSTPPPDPFPLPGPGFELPPPNPNHLDVLAFLQDLHQVLSPNVNGYAARIRHQGKTIGVLQWNWSRNPGDAPALGWNSFRRMHIASISKFMTAIGLMHLLETSGRDIEDKMAQFLPAYWNRFAGANELITFENLMNHQSGFSTGGSSSNWQTMKSNVEAGVSAADVGSTPGDYENMNFGLIRILIATIGGYISPNTNFGFGFLNDVIWDVFTWVAYEDYMRTYVFNPVGVFPQIDKNLNTTLAYRFDATASGWNSGNFSGSPGGVGWHMSVYEILEVVRALRTNQIVSVFTKFDLLNLSLGLNSPINGEPTAAGPIYYKAGRWTRTDNVGIRTEQCFLLIMPNEMELVVFVNSPIGAGNPGASLTNIVRTLFFNNIVGS